MIGLSYKQKKILSKKQTDVKLSKTTEKKNNVTDISDRTYKCFSKLKGLVLTYSVDFDNTTNKIIKWLINNQDSNKPPLVIIRSSKVQKAVLCQSTGTQEEQEIEEKIQAIPDAPLTVKVEYL